MVAIGTRFFGKDPAKDLPRLSHFIEAGQKIGQVHVAVNVVEDNCDTIGLCTKHYPDVDVFAVTPWQKFVAPLNAIIYRAALSGANRLLLASAEFAPTAEQVATLLKYIDGDTAVAGARLSEHEFREGRKSGRGVTVPWNTFALWNLDLLADIGFPLVGDAAFDVKQAGVEEVSALALLQKLYGVNNAKAKLVQIPGFYEEWNTDGWDEERHTKHEAKIASKNARPFEQLIHTGWQEPFIHHIIHRP